MQQKRPLHHLITTLAFIGLVTPAIAGPQHAPKGTSSPAHALPSAVKAKPLNDTVSRGLNWLVEHQLADGGWGQGEESARMRQQIREVAAQSNVADTAMATLSLLRAGSTPSAGQYAPNINRGLDFVLSQIEASDRDSLWVTSVRGTRVQSKIGPYVGTFLSAQLLAEVKGKMASIARNKRVEAALAKVLHKMETNQREDGGYTGRGWAPVLSQALAVKGTNRAFQLGATVSREMRDRSAKWAAAKFDQKNGTFSSAGSAGIDLYGTAATVGGLGDSALSDDLEAEDVAKMAVNAPTESGRAKAKTQLARMAETKRVQKAANTALVARMSDQKFMQGFGSNGGEEFLSYMLVSETLMAQGGDEWARWDAAMARNLGHVQNGDGSWTGHHCITGRTFCTAAALLVLMADRAPVPLAKEMSRG